MASVGSPTVQDFVDALGRMVPFAQARWDDCAGLQVGSPGAPVARALLAVAPSLDLIGKLRPRCVHLLIAYRPLFDGPLRSIDPASPVAKTIAGFAAANCALIACGSALDASPLGPNRLVADALGLREVEEVRAALCAPSDEVKIAVFTPTGHETAIIEAIAAAGGGVIGKYSHCTFRSPGTGTYQPLEGAKPWVGEVGRLESAEETRLEARVPRARLADVMRRVRAVHPYEEMAYDVYPLEEISRSGPVTGLVGNLPRALTISALAAQLRLKLGEGAVPRGQRHSAARVDKVFLALGARAIPAEEALRAGANLLLTDEPPTPQVRRSASLGAPALEVLKLNGAALRNRTLQRLADSLSQEPALRGCRILLDRPRR